MGKIPGKKHKKIKDPEKQKLVRDFKIKDKINDPPTNPDDQHVPKSVTKLAEVMQKIRASGGIKKKKKSKKAQPSAFFKTLGLKVTQEKQESGRNFLQRVHKACGQVLKESKFEETYKVKIQRNPETNEVEKLIKQNKLDIDIKNPKLKKGKKGKGKKQNEDEEIVTKKNRKKKKKEEEPFKDFSDNQDIVKFGDVAHAPPNLQVPHKIAKIKSLQPGDRDLLLKNVISNNKKLSTARSKIIITDSKQNKTVNKTNVSEAPDRKGKRKNLPPAIRQRLDAQQKEVIAAYKNLKKQKAKTKMDS